jgi:segregation and condensation protein A
VWSLTEAREALERLVGATTDWRQLDAYLINYVVEPALRPTIFASSLAATLELVREGRVEMHQHAAFAPIFLRRRLPQAAGQEPERQAPPAPSNE